MTIGSIEGFLWERKRKILGKEVFLSRGLRDRLRQARQELTPRRGGYVSQETLAAEVGVSGVTLGNYESGTTEPSLEMIERLAKVLGVSPAFLAFGATYFPVENPEDVEVPVPSPPQSRRKQHG